jgi:hypothetical protein
MAYKYNLALRMTLASLLLVPIFSLSPINCAALDAAQSPVANAAQKIKFKSATGSEFWLQGDKQHGAYEEGGAKTDLVVSRDLKLISIQQSGRVIGYVTMKQPNEWKIKDDSQKELFTLKLEADGHYKLKDAGNTEIYKIKPESFGFKIKNKDGQELYKIHSDGTKVSLKSPDGKVVAETHASIAPIAVACFGLDVLSKSQKAALAYALSVVKS